LKRPLRRPRLAAPPALGRERPQRQLQQQRRRRQQQRPLEALLARAHRLALQAALFEAVDLPHQRRRIGGGAGDPQIGAAGRGGHRLQVLLVQAGVLAVG
jgi:hypothetical protein